MRLKKALVASRKQKTLRLETLANLASNRGQYITHLSGIKQVNVSNFPYYSAQFGLFVRTPEQKYRKENGFPFSLGHLPALEPPKTRDKAGFFLLFFFWGGGKFF